MVSLKTKRQLNNNNNNWRRRDIRRKGRK
jgi:hypothetical protein